MLSSSSLLGLFVSILGVVTTAVDFSQRTRLALSATLGVICLIPLLVNFFVFLQSPFSRWLHVKNEFYKFLLMDSFEHYEAKWCMQGRGIYCNQSMVPRSVHPSLIFLCDAPKPDETGLNNVVEKMWGLKIESQSGMLKDTWDLSFSSVCNGGRQMSGLWLLVDGDNLETKIRSEATLGAKLMVGATEMKFSALKLSGDAYAFELNLSARTYQSQVIKAVFTWDQFLTIVAIISFHSDTPETGLCSYAGFVRKVLRLHSISYQETVLKLSKGHVFRLGLVDTDCSTIVEGLEGSAAALSLNLPDSFVKKFGNNQIQFCMHHIDFWGKPNLKAIDAVINRRVGHYSRLMRVGSNWKHKRYMVDISYLLELIGGTRLSVIDKSIKPTMLARKAFSTVEKLPTECDRGGVYVRPTDAQLESLRLQAAERARNKSALPSDRQLFQTLRNMKQTSRLKKFNKESIKQLSDFTQCTKDYKRIKTCEDSGSIARIEQIKSIIDSNVEVNYKESLDSSLSKLRTPYKDALLKASQALTVELKEVINVKRYSEEARQSEVSWKRRFRWTQQLCKHSERTQDSRPRADCSVAEGKKPLFPLRPRKLKQTELFKPKPIGYMNRFSLLSEYAELKQEHDDKIEANRLSSTIQIRPVPTIIRRPEMKKLRIPKSMRKAIKAKRVNPLKRKMPADVELPSLIKVSKESRLSNPGTKWKEGGLNPCQSHHPSLELERPPCKQNSSSFGHGEAIRLVRRHSRMKCMREVSKLDAPRPVKNGLIRF